MVLTAANVVKKTAVSRILFGKTAVFIPGSGRTITRTGRDGGAKISQLAHKSSADPRPYALTRIMVGETAVLIPGSGRTITRTGRDRRGKNIATGT